MAHEIVVGLIYGTKQHRDGSLDRRGVAHCMKAIDLYRCGKVDRLCITVGGRWRRAGRSMGREMKGILESRGVPKEDILFFPSAENGAGEAQACIELCEMHFGVDSFTLIPILSEFYRRRMAMILGQLGVIPQEWAIASTEATPWIRFMEHLKYFNSRYRLRCKRVNPALQ